MANGIETNFQAAIDAGKINGAVVCASDAEGHFVYDKAFGERTLLSGEKQSQKLDDVLFIASCTKLITTVAALQCVEDGLLTLHGDLSSAAPELGAKQALYTNFFNPNLAKWCEKFAPSQEGERQSVEKMFSYPLSFQPGASWMYGPSLDWAGRVVERVTGGTLLERMQKRIFDPLGITDAQFQPVTREDLRSRLVDLNPDDPEALGHAVLPGMNEMNARSQGDFGGHGLNMTAVDYVKVLRSLLANDSKLLKPATVDDMFSHHLSPEATTAQQSVLARPFSSLFLCGTDLETKPGHGLGGLLTRQDVDGWYGEHTLSWGGGLTLAWFIDRKNNLCGVGSVQAKLPFDDSTVTELKQIFRRDVYRKRAAWKEQQQVS